MPPQGEWASLETALVEQGLIQTPKRGFVVSPTWIRLAAGLLLFIGGTAFGSAFDGAGMPMSASQDGVDAQNTFASVDDAAAAVRQAERQWMAAMGEYRRLSEEGGLRRAPRDPASRFAAIEALLAASQAAIQESPADPFFNGVLVSTLAERDRALRQIRSSNGDNWY